MTQQTQQTQQQDKLREAFEAAYIVEKLRVINSEGSEGGEQAIRAFHLRRNEAGDYDSSLEAHFAWWAWQAASAQAVPQGWLPTPENINALPEPLRKYICDLETIADPSCMVRENTLLKDQNKGLQVMYRNAADAIAAAPQPEAQAAPADAKQAVQWPAPVAFIDTTRQECRMAGSWMVAADWNGLYTEQQVRAMLDAASNSVESHQIKTAAPAAPVLQPRYRLLVPEVDRIEANDEFLSEDTLTWAVDPNAIFSGMIFGGRALRPCRRCITGAHNAD